MEEPASEASYAWSAAQSASEAAARNHQALAAVQTELEKLQRVVLEHDDGTPRLTKKQITQRIVALEEKVNLNTAQVEEVMKAIEALAAMNRDTRELVAEIKDYVKPASS